VVYAYDGSTPDAAYAIPGTVKAGTHDPRDVGVRIPLTVPPAEGNGFRGRLRGVGDQNGDGGDDLALDTGRLDVGLYSGREVLAQPPGTTTSLPVPFRTVDNIISVVSMGNGEPHAIIEMFGTFLAEDGTDRIELRVLRQSSVDCLLTTSGPVEHGPADLGTALVAAWTVDSHRLIELRANIRNTQRPVYRWDLDSPN
jgi:hypothetical protein